MVTEEDPIISELRSHRLRAGLSLPRLAELADISSSTLRSAEDGRHVASLRTLRAWTKALGQRLELLPAPTSDGPWLIWSVRKHSWCADLDGGITDNLWRARRFTDQHDLSAALFTANQGQFGAVPFAVSVSAPEGTAGMLSVAQIIDAPTMMSDRVNVAVLAEIGRVR